MHITALCPFCRSAYQVQATLRGQLVRCPNAACRKIFTVPKDVPPPEPPAATPPPRPHGGGGQLSGTVGDLVPILPSEQAAPSVEPSGTGKHVSEVLPVAPVAPETTGQPIEGDWWQAAPPPRSQPGIGSEKQAPAARSPAITPPATVAPWWQNAPPVRAPQRSAEKSAPAAPTQQIRPLERPAAETQRRPAGQEATAPTQPLRPLERPAAETQQMPALTPEKSDQPRELPPGVWQPPPVRRGPADETQDTQPQQATEASETHQPPVSMRRVKLLITGLLVLVVCAFGIGGTWAWMTWVHNEERLSGEARELHSQGSFSNAAEKYGELLKKFPNSEHRDEWRFMADWSTVSSMANDPDADVPAAVAQFEEFVKDHKKDPLMIEHAHDAGQRLIKLTKTFASRNANPADEKPLKDAERIEQLRRLVAGLDGALSKADSEQIDAELGQVRKAVEIARKRREVLAQIRRQKGETWMDAIKRSESVVASMERELPGIGQEAQGAIAKLYDAHLESVVYKPNKGAVAPPPEQAEDDAETLWFASLLPTAAPGQAKSNDPVVLALVRGVLYALKKSNGELKWAKRVGPDTTVLPIRVPQTASSPELFLVLSADTQTLSALPVDGKEDALWEYHVGQPVLGRPVIIDQRAYLADYSGRVHEIELSRGQLLGRWFLGQPLTRGGTREGDTSRIYFPADDSCIYVLDVDPDPTKRRCVNILYDRHPSGSLRSEPVIIAPSEGENSPSYLILNQTNGLDSMQLKVFELPLQDRHAAPVTLEPPPRMPGWTWFEPKEDGEKLAVLSDAGNLGLFGIQQMGNKDQALFPLLQQGGLDLSPFLPSKLARSRERGRAQVIHMQGDDLWVLAHGQLQQIHLGWKEETGPQAKPGWKEPLKLGSPLHEAQRLEDRNTGSSTFYLVTQALEQPTCLASAVDEEGKVLWQRQLGLVCQGEPLVLTPPGGGSPLLLALDQGGGLFVLDPLQPKLPRALSEAPALAENPRVPPRLLLAPDGRSAYEVAAPGDGQWLIVRHIEWSGDRRELEVKPYQISLLSSADDSILTPAGPPIVVGPHLLMPMTDGNFVRVSLKEGKLLPGDRWRVSRAPTTTSCSMLALGGDRFLATDGSRGISVWEWPSDKDIYRPLPKEGEPGLQLEHLVAAPPVLVPAVSDQQPGVAVADSSGVLRLYILQPDGSLKAHENFWKLPGDLTAGPFVQSEPKGGWRIGCVLDGRRLLWLDPQKKDPLWTYPTDGSAIIGHPQRIGDMLVAALQSGRYVGIDPNTGEPTGRGYKLRTSAAPVATPVPFGPGRMFTSLTDGTALLISLDRLREPAKK